MWIQRRNEEAIARRKQDEVQQRVNKWAMNRSREESEHLRKRESMKLVAGLERTHHEDQDEHSRTRTQKHQVHETRSRADGETRAETDARDNAATASSSGARPRTSPSTQEVLRTGGSASAVVLKQSTKKPDMKVGGGMHFRNQLPANYTPPSRHSNQSSASSVASWKDRGLSASPSALTPSSFASEKQIPKHHGDDTRTRRDSASSSGSSGFSDDGDSTDEERADDRVGNPAVEGASRLAPSDHPASRRRAKLEPYHIPFFTSACTGAQARSERTEAYSRIKVRAVVGRVCSERTTEDDGVSVCCCRCILAAPSLHKTSRSIQSSAISTRRQRPVE